MMGGYAVVYLDHAATTPVRSEVLDAMSPYYSACFANASSGYAAARESRKAIDRARGQVAAAIGAKRSEVYFTSGGSEADNWAIIGAALANPDKKHLITSCIEHHAVLNTCRMLEKTGYDVTYLECDRSGRVSASMAEAAIRPDTLMISLMLANNEIGTLEPVAEVISIAKRTGVLVHTDAVQAVGHIPVNVASLDVDLLSMSAHKFCGPKGIGALYVKGGVRIDPLIYGGAQERSMRAGTENTPAIVGMGKAIELACAEMQDEAVRVSQLRGRLSAAICGIPGLHINGDPANMLPSILHATIDQANTSLLLMQMDMCGIAVSGGSACTSGASSRSHVARALGYTEDGQADIRFSIGKDNTESDIDAAAAALRRCLKR